MGKTQGKTITDKQARFAQEYIIDNNATQAAIRAGYAKISARVSGHKCITNHNVKAEITRLQDKIAQKTARTVESIDLMQQAAYDLAMSINQPSAAVSAGTAIARLYGMDKDVVTDTAKIELDAAQAVEAKRLAQIRLYAG